MRHRRLRYRRLVTAAAALLVGAVVLVPLLRSAPDAEAKADANPGPRDVIVHLFEWPWASIASECTNVLGPKGFGAVQVSPPQEHVVLAGQGYPWWQDYQPVSYQLVSRRGNRAAFASMVQTCHNAGVKIYVDAVINHMAGGASTGSGSAGSTYSHYSYPAVPYGSNDFHHCGRNGNDDIVNWTDRWEVQNCELVDLSDLATESAYVRGKLAAYLNDLISLGVDGFRIDAAKHMPVADLQAIFGQLNGSPYIFHEVIEGGAARSRPAEYAGIGDVTEFRYGDVVGNAFRDGNLANLNNLAGADGAGQRRRGQLHRQPRHPAQRPGPADLQGRPDPRAGPGVQPRLPVRHAAADEQLHLHQQRRRPAGRRQRHHQPGHLRLAAGSASTAARPWPTWSASTTRSTAPRSPTGGATAATRSRSAAAPPATSSFNRASSRADPYLQHRRCRPARTATWPTATSPAAPAPARPSRSTARASSPRRCRPTALLALHINARTTGTSSPTPTPTGGCTSVAATFAVTAPTAHRRDHPRGRQPARAGQLEHLGRRADDPLRWTVAGHREPAAEHAFQYKYIRKTAGRRGHLGVRPEPVPLDQRRLRGDLDRDLERAGQLLLDGGGDVRRERHDHVRARTCSCSATGPS